MATALAGQLAQIRRQTSNPLDLKAQKKAHSQSLIFEPRVAGEQDFDSIYQLCYEGFEDLCHLDARFLVFVGTIFSEQSKNQDRTQMTSTQNKELDLVLEDFICLVSGRLSLKSALKAVEWIIRRFRVHENNILSLALAFLPYHMTPTFTTVLSILPQKLPQQVKFLHPYIQSLANPPRHTILHSASNSKPFVTALSRFVVKSCEMGCQYSALLTFWASIATEAIATMIDQARSARREAQKQNQEDILIFVLPILNDGLSVKNAPDLRVGCYMILTVLASKADLDENALTAMMEAVVSEWESTSHAGLICLAVIAQRRQKHKLPRKVLKAMLSLLSLTNDLIILHAQYEVDRLVLGVVTGILKGIVKTGKVKRLTQVRNLLEACLMHEPSFNMTIGSILSIVDQPNLSEQGNSDVQGCLTDLVLRLADSQQVGSEIQSAVEYSKLNLGYLRARLQSTTEDSEMRTPMLEDTDMRDADEQDTAKVFDDIASRIPIRTAYEISFLSHSESYIYDNLAQVFRSIHTSTTNVDRFSNLPVLRKALAMTEPLFVSFYIRLWCSNSPAIVRASALRTVAKYMEDNCLTSDVQILLPYIIYALADPSPPVRRAAADLVLILSPAYVKATEMREVQTERTLLGHGQIYGQNEQSKSVTWLSMKDSTQFVVDLMVPSLEECTLDEQAVSHLLSDRLNGLSTSRDFTKIHPELKTSLRLSIFSFLSSHVVNSPLFTFKLRMLRILNNVEKIGSTSRTKLLLPLLSHAVSIGQERFQTICHREKVDTFDLYPELTGTVTSSDREGLQTLGHIIQIAGFEPLRWTALQRIITIWPQMKANSQLSLSEVLLDLSVRRDSGDGGEAQSTGAINALQSVRLSTATLQHFLSDLPTLSVRLQEKPSTAKRRRTSHGHLNTNNASVKQSFDEDVRRITLVLELVESSKAEQHPALLKGLFQTLSDLKNAQSHSSLAMGYLQILAMDSMLAIVTKAKMSHNMPIDASAIRVDVLIDYVRTGTNPQVRNAALLLVAGLADEAPELVLHSIMPIFTYMGANVLRQEDDFSAYVVQQTMESVIPRLVQSLHSGSKDAFAGISELLVNFAAAFEHIPQQRRLDIFGSIVGKVGAADYLFALFVILSDKYPGNKKALQLSLQLCSHHPVLIQLKTLEKYLQVLLDAWEHKSTNSPNLLLLDQGHSAEVITNDLLPLAVAIFESELLILKITKVLKKQTADAEAVRASIANIFEQIFLLSQHCQDSIKLDSLCMKLLNISLNSLPTKELVHILESLLCRADDDLRRQVLESFEHRLINSKFDDEASRDSCLAFAPRLVSTLQESKNPLLKESAVSAIDRIMEKFGRTDLPMVVEAARTISGDMCLGAQEASLRAASLLCLATTIKVCGEMIIPILPLALPNVSQNLEVSITEDTEDASLHNACYSVYLAMLLYVPWMITGPDLDRILTISYESANAEMGPEHDRTRKETLQSLARQINVKELFAALDRTWASAVTEGPRALNEHFEVLRLAIDRQPKSVVVQLSETLGGIFLKAFSLRRAQSGPRTEDSYDDDEIEAAEAAINETAIAMIYKLNDASFRPLFQRIMEWATSTRGDSEGDVFRRISWYTFLHQFFDVLKSIVTNYAAFIVEDAVQVLQNVRPKDKDSMHLWRKVVQTLQKTFEHDQDDFYQAPSHFTPVFTALLSQISHAAQIPLTAEVIPAITELAVASDSATQHKEMNSAILKYLRSDVASVRLAAVQCERALTDRLGEEWLALLPEMLPFISELQEDDDETVEKETLRWISRIEEILGESLNDMLQ